MHCYFVQIDVEVYINVLFYVKVDVEADLLVVSYVLDLVNVYVEVEVDALLLCLDRR